MTGKTDISTYDGYDFVFNAESFHHEGGGRLGLWLADSFVGEIKTCCPVQMDLEGIPEIYSNPTTDSSGQTVYGDVSYEFPDKWLLQLDRAYLERGYSNSRMALYNAAFEAAKTVGAAGVVSEWDEPRSKKVWAALARKHNAVIETRQVLIGLATDHPRYEPVYVAIFIPDDFKKFKTATARAEARRFTRSGATA